MYMHRRVSGGDGPRFNRDKMTVFQVHPEIHVQLYNVRDSLVATRSIIDVQSKRDYFDGHGIDFDNVCKYYSKVCALNDVYNKPEQKNTPEMWRDFLDDVLALGRKKTSMRQEWS